jgi:hypothetical protein
MLKQDAGWIGLGSLGNDEDLEKQKKIDKLLAVLCFLIFAFIGYMLVHYLPL